MLMIYVIRQRFWIFLLFADDTTIFMSASNILTLNNIMNSELDKVADWCNANFLSLNVKKQFIWCFTALEKNYV